MDANSRLGAVVKLNSMIRNIVLVSGLLAVTGLLAAADYSPEALRLASLGVSLSLGILYAGAKQNDLAIAQFRAAARFDPTAFDAHYRLAHLYSELGRTKDADAEFAIVRKLHEKKDAEPLMKISGP
jgi:Tfp pilus assembly protein PilF